MNQPAPTRPPRLITIAHVVVMLVRLVLALAKPTTSASDLPPLLPRHQGGIARPHAKHGIAAGALAVVLADLAYFSLGAKDDAHRPVICRRRSCRNLMSWWMCPFGSSSGQAAIAVEACG